MSEPTLKSLQSEVTTLSDRMTSLDVALERVRNEALDPQEVDRRLREIVTKTETTIC